MNAHFKGTLEFCGTLTVGEHAELEADIRGGYRDRFRPGLREHHRPQTACPDADGGRSRKYRGPETEHRGRRGLPGNCQMTEDLLDITEVSRYLEIDMKEIEVLANSGKIPGRREGNSWKFQRSQIDHWASSGKIS